MRAYSQGDCVRVVASADDVSGFNDSWPCSSLPDSRVSFTFANTGDLVDLSPDEIDGPEVCALADDCRAYAERRGLFAKGGA